MLDARDAVLVSTPHHIMADVEASVKDIEDIVQEGKRSCVCPYYATRRAVKQSQVSQHSPDKASADNVACHIAL
jgi:chromosome transmission fidelity protein 1